MPPTIVELGRLAGCSPATVSRALNNSGSVSDKTRKAIVQALRQTQYMSKRSARKMRRSTRETGELIEVVLHYRAPYEPLSVGQGGLQVGPLTEPPEQDALAVPGRLTGNFLRQIVNGVLESWPSGGIGRPSRPPRTSSDRNCWRTSTASTATASCCWANTRPTCGSSPPSASTRWCWWTSSTTARPTS